MLIALALLWMAALSWFDVRERRLPNWLTMPGFAAIVVAAGVTGRGAAALTGAGLLAVVYLAVHLLSPAAMGAGDVKLALGLGSLTACFGPEVWVLAAVGATLLTAVIGTVARVGWSVATVPHGPSMCAASAAAVLLG
ncbi:A24 family peptidase [Candidatus Mycobacterium wuenschmannii]|uniref:A24 family peptidase n=1 Tax=Candidatus Mycobacterium wuenschmannii TaxID=3027808 RepID=A0ABY8W471_9MYCO|nr:A24 family peptidase [Candidatus Mycobacterium wuenschmannii]WIM88569.1 A24 family peptidase [Candidatus Mycobacterium wuenschmannii]